MPRYQRIIIASTIANRFAAIIVLQIMCATIAWSQAAWIVSHGGAEHDYVHSMCRTPKHGFALSGSTNSYDGDMVDNPLTSLNNYNGFVSVFDSSGSRMWTRLLGSKNGGTAARALFSTQDNGFVVTGLTYPYDDGDFSGMSKGGVNDIFVVSLDSVGTIRWKNTFGGSGYEGSTSIAQTSDGGFVIAGFTYSDDGDFSGMGKGTGDIVVFKINAQGTLVWKRVLGGSKRDDVTALALCRNGDVVIVGTTESNDHDFAGMAKVQVPSNTPQDIFIIKLRSDGTTLWTRVFGGSKVDDCASVVVDKDDAIIVCGATSSNDNDFDSQSQGSRDAFVMRLSSNATIQWTRRLSGRGTDIANGLALLDDSTLVVTGGTNSRSGDFTLSGMSASRVFLAYLKLNGNLVAVRQFGGAPSEDNRYAEGIHLAIGSGGRVIIAGETTFDGGDFVRLSLGKTDVFLLAVCPLVPPTPIGESPKDRAVDVELPVALTWTTATCVNAYDVQLGRDLMMVSTVIDSTLLPGRTLVANDLDVGTTYYWRVRSRTAESLGEWSPVLSFTTTKPQPSNVALQTPTNGAAGVSSDITLKWLPSSRALMYLVDVASDSLLVNKVVNGATSTINELQVSLVADRRYFWRVRAGNTSGMSPWSEVWTFTVRPARPATPMQMRPSNGSVEEPMNPLFVWQGQSSNERELYRLHVARDSNFVFTERDIERLSPSHRDTLEANTTYYWRVQASNQYESGDWSATWSFKTGTTVRVDESSEDADLRATYADGTLTIHVPTSIMTSSACRLELIDLAGRSIVSASVTPTSTPMRMVIPPLNRGTYVLTLTADSGSPLSARMMVE